MEKKKIISGDGDGYGDGSGYGYGSGSGDGSGDGDGYGSGYGSGYGYGSGDGDGYGYGDGSGDGSGSGSGDGYGDGYTLLTVREQKVLYVDGIPCLPVSAHGDTMAVDIIDEQDWTLSRAYVARWQGEVAHGKTVRQAVEAAKNKYFARMDPGEKKRQLLDLFAEKGRLTVKELYAWHGRITGSCEFGRSRFQEEHGLKDDDTLSLEEFVELTRNDYGGDLIASFLEPC